VGVREENPGELEMNYTSPRRPDTTPLHESQSEDKELSGFVEVLTKRFIRSWSDEENQVLTVIHHGIETRPIAHKAPVFT
jgi:hypothetical protein